MRVLFFICFQVSVRRAGQMLLCAMSFDLRDSQCPPTAAIIFPVRTQKCVQDTTPEQQLFRAREWHCCNLTQSPVDCEDGDAPPRICLALPEVPGCVYVAPCMRVCGLPAAAPSLATFPGAASRCPLISDLGVHMAGTAHPVALWGFL